MIAAYLESWRNQPRFNVLFLCAMVLAWCIYALIWLTGIAWGSQAANILVFVVAAICFIFIFVLPKYSFRVVAVHYFIMVATLIPSLANGQELMRQSGYFS